MQDCEIATYLKMTRIKYKLTNDINNFLSKKDYQSAVDLLYKILNHELYINDYYPYYKLSQIYKLTENRKEEREIIKEFFKTNRYCSQKTIDYFKKRLKDLRAKKIDKIVDEYYESGVSRNSSVPVLMADEILSIDMEALKLNSKFTRDFTKYNDKATFEDKIKLKYRLIKKGEDFIKSKKYIEALQYFDRLVKHPLFVNDVYPYWSISEIFKFLKQNDARRYYIEKFIKSDIYCNSSQLILIKKALRECGGDNKYELIDYFKANGALNEYSSNIPVPSADEIMDTYKLVDNSIDEHIVLELLFKKIPDDYVFKSTNHILKDDDVDFEADLDDNIVKLIKINPEDLAERQLMLNALQLIRTGKSKSQVAKMLNIEITKLYRWMYKGEFGNSVNTYYFYSELNNIEKVRLEIKLNRSKYIEVNNFKDLLNDSFTQVKLSTVDVRDKAFLKLIRKYEKFFRGSYYNRSIKEYNLTIADVESIKHRILDEILLEKIKGDDVDFSGILKDYCINYAENKRRLNDDEFDEIFATVDDSKLTLEDAFECRLKTIRDYNSNFIIKNSIADRYASYLTKKDKQNHQLERLEEIIASPNTPEVKKYLTEAEIEEVFRETREIITSEHGLKGIVLDFVRLNMDKIVNKKVNMAVSEFEKYKDDLSTLTDLNDMQIEDFTSEFELLINKHQILPEDISKEYISKLSQNYLTFGKINI